MGFKARASARSSQTSSEHQQLRNTNLPPTPKNEIRDPLPRRLGRRPDRCCPPIPVTAPDSELDKQDPAEYLPPEWPFLAHRTAGSLAQTELVPLLPTPSSVSTLTDKARAILSENRLEIVC